MLVVLVDQQKWLFPVDVASLLHLGFSAMKTTGLDSPSTATPPLDPNPHGKFLDGSVLDLMFLFHLVGLKKRYTKRNSVKRYVFFWKLLLFLPIIMVQWKMAKQL